MEKNGGSMNFFFQVATKHSATNRRPSNGKCDHKRSNLYENQVGECRNYEKLAFRRKDSQDSNLQNNCKANEDFVLTPYTTFTANQNKRSAESQLWNLLLRYFESMKVIIQRVTHGCIKVNEEIISSIGRGLLVLVGISKNDTKEDLDYITKKILSIRFFDDESGKKWSKNVMDKQFEILCMSQFTLCYNLKGNRLDFHNAMSPDDAIKFYESFLDSLKSQYKPELVKTGKFGAYCQVEFCNDGPVTINLESNKSEGASDGKK